MQAAASPSHASRLAERQRERAARKLALVEVPVKADPMCLPILFQDRDASTVSVDIEFFEISYPDDARLPRGGEQHSEASWKAEGFSASVGPDGDIDNRRNDRAALRASVVEGQDWGQQRVRMAVLFGDRFGILRQAIVEGTEAAIRRALPDRKMLEAWRNAGVTEVPVWDLTPGMSQRRVVWTAIENVVTVLQMEYEARGLAAERRLAREAAYVC